PADGEALSRARGFLTEFGASTGEFVFHAAAGAQREISAIRSQRRADVELITELTRWPLSPSDDWRKGFLAGIFDAEGSCGRQALRVANADRAILDWTTACLRHFGFHA